MTGRHWILNVAAVGAILALVYAGAEFAFYWAAENRMEGLRQEKIAAAGKWVFEEGVSRRFDGRAFIMASTNSALVDGDHYYDLSLLCYAPGKARASLLVLLYKVEITPDGPGAYPLGADDRAELVRTSGGAEYSLTLEFDAASEALETGLKHDISEKIFAGRYGKDFPLLVRGADGDVAFVDSTDTEHWMRRQILDACSAEN